MYKWTVVSILLLVLVFGAVAYLMSNAGFIDREYILGVTTTTQQGAAPGPGTTTPTTTIPDEYAATELNGTLGWLEKLALDLVNFERTGMGLQPLAWNDEVADVSRLHSQDMAEHDFLTQMPEDVHVGTDGSNFSYRLMRDDVYYWDISAENIAMIQTTAKTSEEIAQEAVDLWMGSPTHRVNVLQPDLNEAGIGVRMSNNTYYFTQDFIRRVYCGYKGAQCCVKSMSVFMCYNPWECTDGFCI